MADKVVEAIRQVTAEKGFVNAKRVLAIAKSIQNNEEALKRLLGDVLISNDAPLSESTLAVAERILFADDNDDDIHKDKKTKIPLTTMENVLVEAFWLKKRLGIYRGDLTKLDIDAIVNAANEGGLGCYQPGHRCVDNQIHRCAGPRLRAECRQQMYKRASPLAAGTSPIITNGYRLPAKHVIHVTGPQIKQGFPTSYQALQLAQAYTNTLDLALAHNIRSIAFPCISTGLFGFPSDEAARIALEAVTNWLEKNESIEIQVILVLYAEADVRAYHEAISTRGKVQEQNVLQEIQRVSMEADALLICAGAGASGNPNEFVYTNSQDFSKYYPWLLKFGYSTSYECMGLLGDPDVSTTIKSAYLVAHMHNQRRRFQPNPAYYALHKALQDLDIFIYTSNVDGCFERAGFDKDKIYSPQGDWKYFQCSLPCSRDAFWEAENDLDLALPHVPDLPQDTIPRCKRCGRTAIGNVRGGNWFTHAPYDAAQDRFLHWIDQIIQQNKKLLILEVGVGFNTPTVTRIPMEQICRDYELATLIRVNPQHFKVPSDLERAGRAFPLPMQWSADLVSTIFSPRLHYSSHNKQQDKTSKSQYPVVKKSPFVDSFDWRTMLHSLRASPRTFS
mmetsp:Transcript_20708/g.26804  ORF Transcript_20708/g.26804 Transcript_20708/m.26804 type:complete len:618 (-) Transcript_20708:878-2731(-)